MHRTTERFWRCFNKLPEPVQKVSKQNFQLLKTDPRYPSLHSKGFATEDGTEVGSKEEEILAEYGQPKNNNRFIRYYRSSYLDTLSSTIKYSLIITLVLSLISLYLRRKDFHRQYLILIIASFFTSIIIYTDPLRIFTYGLESYLIFFRHIIQYLLFSLTFPLVLVGIFYGELISKRKSSTGFKKYLYIICFATLGRITAFIIVQLYGMVITNSFYIYWTYSWLVILFAGLLFYFIWLQFNRLLGIKRDYLMIE